MNMAFNQQIKNFLEKETQKKIESDDQNLISAGILDSFSMIKLISFLESDLGIKLDMEELTPENFNSVANISQMAQKWKSAQ